MDNQALIARWHAKILAECERKLGRRLTAQEKRFVVSRGGFIALEAIEDTVRELGGPDLERYLNSEEPG